MVSGINAWMQVATKLYFMEQQKKIEERLQKVRTDTWKTCLNDHCSVMQNAGYA